MFARNQAIFHPTAEGFGSLTVHAPARAMAARQANPALATAGFILALALGVFAVYQIDHALFTPAPHVAHGEIFAVDMD